MPTTRSGVVGSLGDRVKMAEVSPSLSRYGPNMSVSYFPAIPAKAPKAAMSYSQAVNEAPVTALMGVVVDGRTQTQHPVTPRCRMRHQVGYTNRWRLPQSLGSDLLGTAQAMKAINVSMNDSMRNILSAEHPRTSVNMDITKPYTFLVTGGRSRTSPEILLSKAVPPTIPQTAAAPGKSQPEKGLVMNTFTPSTARPPKPQDVFAYHSKRSASSLGPDVLLKCLGINWELHRPFLIKSDTLAALLHAAETPGPKRYYRNKMSETLDSYISKNNFYSAEYQEMSQRLCMDDVDDTEGCDIEHPKHVSEQRVNNMTVIELDLADPLITPHTLAVALGNLYHEEVEVDVHDVVGVSAVAHILKYRHLEDGCASIMLRTINCRTACGYHDAASRTHQERVRTACERWLELNLVPKLSSEIQLRELPMDLLQKILKSNRLFTYSEFWLYRVLVYWVFLRMNPTVQLMPSYSSVLTFFNSLPKSSALIDREEGQHFTALFMALRLHGVTDTNSIQDIQSMNVIPQAWVVRILSQHYHALQGGGDMWLMNNFNTFAVRQGFMLDDEPHYHSEILSLHGFHFELKAVRQNKTGYYTLYMQRLKPGDPILSFRQCERHTFSMRPDRDVRYCIRVQYFDADNQCQMVTTGMLSQRFGLTTKTSKSEVLTVERAVPPLHVTFSLLFPSS